MTKIPYIPETAPFTLEQRAWLNGFLAGLFANGGGSDAPQLNAVPAKVGEPLPILFGSQTGTAEGLAKRIAKEATQRGFAPLVLALNDQGLVCPVAGNLPSCVYDLLDKHHRDDVARL